jgi:hypothetical protein
MCHKIAPLSINFEILNDPKLVKHCEVCEVRLTWCCLQSFNILDYPLSYLRVLKHRGTAICNKLEIHLDKSIWQIVLQKYVDT